MTTPDPQQWRNLAEQVIGGMLRDLGFPDDVVAEKVDEAWAMLITSPGHDQVNLSDPEALRAVMDAAARELGLVDGEGT